jgi:hypothetical protein
MEGALLYLGSNTWISTSQKYASFAKLFGVNLGSAELSTVHQLYITELYQLPDGEIYILFEEFPQDLTQEQLLHRMSDKQFL